MKYFLFIPLIILSAFSLKAQNIVSGRVLDAADKTPLIGATVFVSDLKTGVVTDENGTFILQNLPKGTFLAEVSEVGYAKQVIKIRTTDSTALEILLSVTAVEMQEVIVTGVSSSTERAKNPVPVEQVRRDVFLQNTSTNLIQGLAKLPGISQISTGTAISKPVIRGLGYNRVVVLRNGIRQEGQQWGDEHGIELDENDVERVEIIKGPGSLLYGSDAMAGVVNFLLPHPVAEGKITAEAQTEYQTNSNLAGASLMQAGNIHGFYWQGRGTWQRSGNYKNPVDGHVLDSGSELYAGSSFIGVNRNWGHSQLHFSTYNQRLGIPEGERDSLGNFTGPAAVNGVEEVRSYPDGDLGGWKNSIAAPFQRVSHNRVAWSNAVFFPIILSAELG